MTCSRLANPNLVLKSHWQTLHLSLGLLLVIQETLFLQQWEILTVACAASVSSDFHNRERPKNFGLSLLWKPTETRARLTWITITLFILIGFWLATYDKLSRCRGHWSAASWQVATETTWGRFAKYRPLLASVSFIPFPLPPCSIFSLVPISCAAKLSKSRSTIFLCSENPQKRLLRRLQEGILSGS